MIKTFSADIKVRTKTGMRSDTIVRTEERGPEAAIEVALRELVWVAKAAGLDPVGIVKDQALRLHL